MIEKSHSGICVEPGNIDALSAAMKAFVEDKEKYRDCGANARKYYLNHFTKEKFMVNLYGILEETICLKKGRKWRY